MIALGHNGVWHQHAEAIHLSYIFVFLSDFALCFISYLKNALISVGIIPRPLNKEIYFLRKSCRWCKLTHTLLFGMQGKSPKGDPEKGVWGVQILDDSIRKWEIEAGRRAAS